MPYPTPCFSKNFHEANSHLFAEESRHHNPDDPCDPDEKELVHSSSLFLAIFLQVLRRVESQRKLRNIVSVRSLSKQSRLQLKYYMNHLTLKQLTLHSVCIVFISSCRYQSIHFSYLTVQIIWRTLLPVEDDAKKYLYQ